MKIGLQILVILITLAIRVNIILANIQRPDLVFPEKRMFKENVKRATPLNDMGIKHVVGRMKHLPFIPPRMHPFESDHELKRTIEQDPYMKDHSSSSLYVHSEKHARQALLNGHRSINNILNEGVDFINVKENSNYVEHGSLHSITYNVNLLSGVALLDQDSNVWNVACEENSIKVDFSNGNGTATKWIPGTRLVIGRDWNCYGSETLEKYGKEDKLAFLVLSRTILAHDGPMLKIKFNVKPIQNNELFLSGKAKYHTIPIARESGDRNISSIFQSSSQTRYSQTRRIASVGFNYEDGHVQRERIVIFQSKDQDAQFVCDHCYIYLNMEFKIEFEWSWNSIDKAQAIIKGTFDSEATLKGSVIKSYQASYNKFIEGKPIQFLVTIVAIPFLVELVPKIGLTVNVKTDGSLQYSRALKATYDRYIGLTYSTGNGMGYVAGGQGVKWETSSPGLTISGQAHVDFSIFPTFDVSIFKLAKTSISLIPKLLLDLQLESIAKSLNEYTIFVKLDTYYLCDFEMENEYLGRKVISLSKKTNIPYFSGTFSKQKDNFKAIASSSPFSENNQITQISQVTTTSDSIFMVRIESDQSIFSRDCYYIQYTLSNEYISNPKYSQRTYTKNCENGCQFSFPLYKFIYLQIVKEGYLFDSEDMTRYFDLRHYISNPLRASKILDSGNGRTFSIDVSRIIMKYRALPPNPITITNPTLFLYDGQSNPYMNSVITVFKSDKSIKLSSPHASYPDSKETIHVVEDDRFSITSSLKSAPILTFLYVLPYRNVPEGSIVKLNGEAIRDSQILTTFSQKISQIASKCSVTIQTRGSFHLILTEVWIVPPANYYQTKGKKFSFTESATTNEQESSLPLQSHTFSISLENSYYNISTQQFVFAQIIPIGGVIVETIRFDPIQISEGIIYSSAMIIEQYIHVPKEELIYPYVSVSTISNTTQVNIADTLDLLYSSVTKEYSIYKEQTNIPINPIHNVVYIYPKTGKLIDIQLVHNFKLLNGIPSIVKKINNKESGYFAYSCSNPSMYSGYLRVIEVNSGTLMQRSDIIISASLYSKENFIDSIDVVHVSGGIFSISRMDLVRSLCKIDPSNRYIQFSIQASSERSRFIQVEISQTMEISNLAELSTRSTREFLIDQEKSGYMYIDIGSERNKFESAGKKGFVVTVQNLDSVC